VGEEGIGLGQEAQFMRADGLALVHRHPADKLGKILAEQDLGEQGFDLAELALCLKACGPFG